MDRHRRRTSKPLARAAVVVTLVATTGGLLLSSADPSRGLPSRFAAVHPRAAAQPLPDLLAGAPVPDSAALAARLRDALGARAFNGSLSYLVVDARSGRRLLASGADVGVIPASTVKLAVATAALETLGPTRIRTSVMASGTLSHGVLHGDLVLVGGGDPTLTASAAPGYPAGARLLDLASGVRRAGVTRVLGRVVVDDHLFSGASVADGWHPSYVSEGSVAPVSALEVDEGRPQAHPDRGARSYDPAFDAGVLFRTALRHAGVRTAPGIGRGQPGTGARRLSSVVSPPVPTLVEQMLTDSDNDLAEALGRLVALRTGRPATFAGAAEAVLATLRHLAAPVDGLALSDASGLSRLDRMSPATAVALLRLAMSAAHPELRPMLTGLPVAGFTGTLEKRFRSADTRAGAGVVRAKTGTLTGTSALAGIVVDADGRLLLVDAVTNAVTGRRAAETALDRIAAVLAVCGCNGRT